MNGRFALDARCVGCMPEPEPEPADCLFGDSYWALLSDPAFGGGFSTTVRSDTRTTEARAQQIIIAAQVESPEVVSLDDAFGTFDGGAAEIVGVNHLATGRSFTLIAYTVRDKTLGAAFIGDEPRPVAHIVEGAFSECAIEPPTVGSGLGEECTTADACGAGLRCEGIVAGRGRCANTSPLPGEDASCGAAALPACASGTVCIAGTCRAAWMQQSFGESFAAGDELAIPDDDDAGLSRTLTAFGLGTVAEEVHLRVTLHHEFPYDLLITLTNPIGTSRTIFDGQRDDVEDELLELDTPVGFSGDEDANGGWTLQIVDRYARDLGTLTSWELTIGSRYD